jgi:hypothetical protein
MTHVRIPVLDHDRASPGKIGAADLVDVVANAYRWVSIEHACLLGRAVNDLL